MAFLRFDVPNSGPATPNQKEHAMMPVMNFPAIAPGVEDTDLANAIALLLHTEAECRDHRQRCEHELQRRLEARGATELPHATLEVKLIYPSPNYDISTLRRLYEELPKEVVDQAVTPAHDKTIHVPEAWDARKFKSFAKFGADVHAIIEAARLPAPPKLRVRPKS